MILIQFLVTHPMLCAASVVGGIGMLLLPVLREGQE